MSQNKQSTKTPDCPNITVYSLRYCTCKSWQQPSLRKKIILEKYKTNIGIKCVNYFIAVRKQINSRTKNYRPAEDTMHLCWYPEEWFRFIPTIVLNNNINNNNNTNNSVTLYCVLLYYEDLLYSTSYWISLHLHSKHFMFIKYLLNTDFIHNC